MSTVLQIVLPRIPRTATSLCGGGDDTKEWRKMWRCWLRLTDGKYGRAAGEHAHSHVGTLLFFLSYTLAHSAETPFDNDDVLHRNPPSVRPLTPWAGVECGLDISTKQRSLFLDGFSLLFLFSLPGPVGSVRWWIIPIPPPARRPSSAAVCIAILGVFRIISLLAARHSSLFSFAILQDLGTCFVLQRRPLSHGIGICRRLPL